MGPNQPQGPFATGDLQELRPRCAVAERAWSPRAARYSARTEARLLEFRCVLLGRGVGAGRVRAAKARDAPAGPGSCRE